MSTSNEFPTLDEAKAHADKYARKYAEPHCVFQYAFKESPFVVVIAEWHARWRAHDFPAIYTTTKPNAA